MSEKDLRREFCRLIRALDPVPIENILTGNTGVGTPDVETVAGWVELKWAKAWPKRATTPLRLPHFTDRQKDWAKRRRAHGEECWLVLQVKQDWFIFDSDGMQEVGNLTRDQLIEASRAFFDKKPTPEQLCAVFQP